MFIISGIAIIQTHDAIYAASDTAVSTTLNGEKYRVANNGKKLYAFKDKLIFCSGTMVLAYSIIEFYKNSNDQSLETLSSIAKSLYLAYGDTGKTPNLDIVVMCSDDDGTSVYQISPYLNFKLSKTSVGENETGLLSGGIKTNETLELLHKEISREQTIADVFFNVFDKLKDAQIGGNVDVVRIDKKGIKVLEQYKLDENVQFMPPNLDLEMIIAEQVLGKLILGQRVVIGTDDGTWMTEGAKTTITDRCGRVAMKLGLYEENPDLFGMVINRYNDLVACSPDILNKIIANSEDGFKIQQWNGREFVDKFYVDPNGLLMAVDMTAKRLTIKSGEDELLLDSYTKYMDIGKFENIITDGKLTAIEKLQVLGERTRIISEYDKLLQQANAYKTTTRDSTIRIDTTNFTNNYYNLMDYLAPLLADMEATTEIDRDEFINKFKAYYDEVTNIINAINDSIKYSSVQFGSHFNNVVIDYINGVVATRNDTKFRSIMNGTRGFIIQRNDGTTQNPIWVDLFYADINGNLVAQNMTAKSLKIVSETDELLLDGNSKYMDIGKFDSIITDGKLTAIEKLQVLGERTRIVSEYTKLRTQAIEYATSDRDDSILIDPTNLTNAYEALINYLAPLLDDMDVTSVIDRQVFINKFKDYYDEATNIINAISDSLKYSSVQFGQKFGNNVLIDFLNGVVATRSDNMYRSIMNGTRGFIIQQNIGTSANPNWKDVFYANTEGILYAQGLRIANGLFSDGGIEDSHLVLRDAFGGVGKWYPAQGIWMGSENFADAGFSVNPYGQLKIKGNAGAVFIDTEAGYMDMGNLEIRGVSRMSGDTITVNNVIAGNGFINRLTVDKLITYGKKEDINQVTDYIHVQDNYFTLKTGRITNRTQTIVNGKPLYWADASKTTATDQVTPYPMWNLEIDDITKFIMDHKGTGDAAYPRMAWGRGDGVIKDPWVGDEHVIADQAKQNVKSGRGFIEKPNGSFDQYYFNTSYGRERSVRLMDEGVYILSENAKFNAITKDIEFGITENGKFSITNATGTKITIDTAGNIGIESSGKVDVKAAGSINFDGSSYNFA